MQEYIEIGKINIELLKDTDVNLITDEVIFTLERISHVEDRRAQLFEEVKNILPIAIKEPDYIYKDWNNRNNTLVLIKGLDDSSKLNIVIKIAVIKDEKHTKNSIITIIKIGEKTFKKIYKNKSENLLYKKLDKEA